MKMRLLRILLVTSMIIATLVVPSAAEAQEAPTSSVETNPTTNSLDVNYIPGADDAISDQLDHVIEPPSSGIKSISFTGMDFVPRESATNSTYISGTGCITRTSGSGNFIIDVHLPQGSKLLGLTYQHLNQNASLSYLFITEYNAQGNYSDIFHVSSSTQPGYQESYEAMLNPYVVDNYNNSLNLIWVPAGSGNSLCGATLYYSEPTQRIQDRYWFASAAAFNPADSNSVKDHDGSVGCINRPSGSVAFLLNLDLPNGTVINGIRLYYYNDVPTKMVSTFLNYSNMGGGLDWYGPYNSTLYSGYSSEYFPLPNPIVYNSNLGYELGFHPGNAYNTAVCGIRVFLDYPIGTTATSETSLGFVSSGLDLTNLETLESSPLPRITVQQEVFEQEVVNNVQATTLTQSITGSTFHPIRSDTSMSYQGSGCVSIRSGTERFLVKSVVLPPYAKVKNIRFHYYDSSEQNNTIIYLTQSGRGEVLTQYSVDSSGTPGYDSVLSTGAHFEHLPGSLSLSLFWYSGVNDGSLRLCGATITYEPGYKSFLGLITK